MNLDKDRCTAKVERSKSDPICKPDFENLRNKKKKKRHVRTLIIGSANAGKSTMIRSIRMAHGDEFSVTEMQEFLSNIRLMTLTFLADLLDNSFGGEMDLRRILNQMCDANCSAMHKNIERIGDLALDLIKDAKIQDLLKKVPPNSDHAYFLSKIDDIFQQDYRPSKEDILTLRQPTKR